MTHTFYAQRLRCLLALLTALVVSSWSALAAAENRAGQLGEAFVAIDHVGGPLRIVSLTLPSAGTYEIRVDKLRRPSSLASPPATDDWSSSLPDSVMAVRSSAS